MNFNGVKIAVAVSGGVAAYKACDFVRELQRRGADDVLVLLSEGAKEFVSALTFQSLAKNRVYADAWALNDEGTPLHIAAAQECDAMVVLPATANMMAKMLQGVADDMVSTTVLTFTDKPLLIVPAMNHRMWANPATQDNMQKLAARDGVTFVHPKEGLLACGETGMGHLADKEDILQELYRATTPQKYAGKKVIVTAGGTSEAIDPVRTITNHSSGKMGIAFADELYSMGADVTLIATDSVHNSLLTGRRYAIQRATSAADLTKALDNTFPQADMLVMSAAVSDFTVATAPDKMKRGQQQTMTLELEATEDIVAKLAAKKQKGQHIIAFAAESGNNIEEAERKLKTKNVDAVVLNDISAAGIGFGADENEVHLITATQKTHFSRASKHNIAKSVLLALQNT